MNGNPFACTVTILARAWNALSILTMIKTGTDIFQIVTWPDAGAVVVAHLPLHTAIGVSNTFLADFCFCLDNVAGTFSKMAAEPDWAGV